VAQKYLLEERNWTQVLVLVLVLVQKASSQAVQQVFLYAAPKVQ